MLKQFILFISCLFIFGLLCAQPPADSSKVPAASVKDKVRVGKTVKAATTVKVDSVIKMGTTQKVDSIIKVDSTIKFDSSNTKPAVVIANPITKYNETIQFALENNPYLHTSKPPVAISSKEMAASFTDFIFYVILSTLLLLAFLRFFYTSYFNNLFRVFFNTSLRQSQLTDQLLQAKLASILFNLYFVVTGGLYSYLLLLHYQWVAADNAVMVIGVSIFILALIYFIKYLTLKLAGWLTGNKEVANTYLFIIFLINKILSVILLPFVILMAFAMPGLQSIAVVLSLLLVILMFLLRFLRSFGLLQHKIKVSWFHFFLFIAGVELLPILLIYKGMVFMLTK